MGTKIFGKFMYGYEKKLRVWKFHSAHTPGIKNDRSLSLCSADNGFYLIDNLKLENMINYPAYHLEGPKVDKQKIIKATKLWMTT